MGGLYPPVVRTPFAQAAQASAKPKLRRLLQLRLSYRSPIALEAAAPMHQAPEQRRLVLHPRLGRLLKPLKPLELTERLARRKPL